MPALHHLTEKDVLVMTVMVALNEVLHLVRVLMIVSVENELMTEIVCTDHGQIHKVIVMSSITERKQGAQQVTADVAARALATALTAAGENDIEGIVVVIQENGKDLNPPRFHKKVQNPQVYIQDRRREKSKKIEQGAF